MQDSIMNEKENDYSSNEYVAGIYNRVTQVIEDVDAFTDIHIINNYLVEVQMEGETSKFSFLTSNVKGIDYFKECQIPDASLTANERKTLEKYLQVSVRSAIKSKRLICNRSGLFFHENINSLVIGNKYWGASNDEIVIKENISCLKWRQGDSKVTYHEQTLRLLMNIAPGTSEILAFSILVAPMKPFFEMAGFPFEGCINVFGKSGSFKTSVVNAITNIVTKPELLRASFLNNRKKELLKRLDDSYGFVLHLSDYHPTARNYDMKKQEGNMDAVARHLENNHNTALVIMTSEFLDGTFSLQDRMVQIKMHKVDLDLLTKLQNSGERVSYLVIDFIDKLMKNYSEVIDFIRKTFENNVEIKDDVSSRLDRNGMYFKIAAELYLRYFDVTDDQILQRLDLVLKDQASFQRKRLKALRRIECDEDYISALYDVLVSKTYEVCIQSQRTYECKNNQYEITKTGMLYITKNAIRYGFKVHFGLQNIKMRKLISALHEYDLLIEDTDAIAKKHCNVRHLCINLYELSNYMASTRGCVSDKSVFIEN